MRERMRTARVLVLCWVVIIASGASAQSAAGKAAAWRAGAAKIQITPEVPMWMSGYASRNRPADGKLTDLWAKALALQDAQRGRGVLITLDLVGIDRGLSLSICERLRTEYTLARSQIAICSSHTHTGPVVARNLRPLHYERLPPGQRQLVEQYAEVLENKVVQVVGQALERLAECELSWGNGRSTFAVNRRENKPYETVPQWRQQGKLQGPVDHDVPVLAVRRPSGTLQAVVFGYACHCTVLSSYQWSGDYAGFAQIELEASYPDCVALFWAGCGADQNPLPRRTVQLAKHYGRRLADAVDSVLLTSQMRPIQGALQTSYREIDLPLGKLPSQQQLEEEAQSANRFVAARAKMLLSELQEGSPLRRSYPYPVQLWRFGDETQFITLGGEVVVDFAIRLKSELNGQRTWVAGYANDVMAYIPSLRVLREGGYEGGGAMVYYGLPTVWAPAVEDDIIREVRRQVGAQ